LRNVPGRKTDVADAVWLGQLVEHGRVRPSCAPPKPIRALRNLTRYRKAQIEERTREAQRLDAEELDAWGAVARADCQDGLPQLHHPTSVGETNDTLWINGSRIRSLTH